MNKLTKLPTSPPRLQRPPPSDAGENNGKFLAEKTVEDVLRYFGNSIRGARTNYRRFVEKGIKQGRRKDLQGGGLIRSAGGDRSGLFGQKNEDREQGDARILGSGDFVSTTLQQFERILEKKYRPKRSMEELIALAVKRSGLKPELIRSGSRQKNHSQARSLFAWLAVEEEGHPAAAVARFLGISRVGVKKALERRLQSGQQGFPSE